MRSTSPGCGSQVVIPTRQVATGEVVAPGVGDDHRVVGIDPDDPMSRISFAEVVGDSQTPFGTVLEPAQTLGRAPGRRRLSSGVPVHEDVAGYQYFRRGKGIGPHVALEAIVVTAITEIDSIEDAVADKTVEVTSGGDAITREVVDGLLVRSSLSLRPRIPSETKSKQSCTVDRSPDVIRLLTISTFMARPWVPCSSICTMLPRE
jgi:hypothetical protein